MSQPSSKPVPESDDVEAIVDPMAGWGEAEWTRYLKGIDHAATERRQRADANRLLQQFRE